MARDERGYCPAGRARRESVAMARRGSVVVTQCDDSREGGDLGWLAQKNASLRVDRG